MDTWVKHSARVLPTTGELDLVPNGSGGLLEAMRQLGYSTAQAKLISGYGDYRVGDTGDNQGGDYETEAIKGTVLEGLGMQVLPDCKYTKYGVGVINDDSSEGWPSTPPRTFSVATAILAGDPEAPRN